MDLLMYKMVSWCSGPTCLPVTEKTTGSNPVGTAMSKRCSECLIQHLNNGWMVGSISRK